MAIQINGTEVIGNNKSATNLTGLTVNGSSFIDATSDVISTVFPNASNVITLDASTGNNFSTYAIGSGFAIVHKASYDITNIPGTSSAFDRTYTISLPAHIKQYDIVRVLVSANADVNPGVTVAGNVTGTYTSTAVREDLTNLHYSNDYIKYIGTASADTTLTITNNNTADISLSVLVFVTRNESGAYSFTGSNFSSTSGTISLVPPTMVNASAGVVLIYGFTNTNVTSTTVAASDGFTLIGKANATTKSVLAAYRILSATTTVTPTAFLGALGTGVWSAKTNSRQINNTVTVDPTISITNVPSGVYSCVIELDYYSGTITWPSITWDTVAAPTFQTMTKNLVFLTTANSGSTWFGTSILGYTI